MLDWFSETMLKIVTSVPALLWLKIPYFYGHSSDVRIDPDARRVPNCDAAISLRYCPLYGEGVQSVRAETVK
jgi:hypothetical protein